MQILAFSAIGLAFIAGSICFWMEWKRREKEIADRNEKAMATIATIMEIGSYCRHRLKLQDWKFHTTERGE